MAVLMSQKHGDVLVVYFNQARLLEESTLQEVGRELLAFSDRCPSQKMLLNFEAVKFMSSAMLGKLVQLNKKCKQDEIKLKLCSIGDTMIPVFQMTRLDKVLDIKGNEEQALKAFEAGV